MRVLLDLVFKLFSLGPVAKDFGFLVIVSESRLTPLLRSVLLWLREGVHDHFERSKHLLGQWKHFHEVQPILSRSLLDLLGFGFRFVLAG